MRYFLILAAVLLIFSPKKDAIDAPCLKDPTPNYDEAPVFIPKELRQKNWLGNRGSGSCVIASTVMALRWANDFSEATEWRNTYGNGQTWSMLHAKLDANGIGYYSTTRGDDSVLEWSSKTRRPCVITYWPAHAVLFCGYTVRDGKEYAAILDNNRISNLIFVPKQSFLSNWKTKYWGCATVILSKPTPMLPSWNTKEDA